MKAKHWYAPAGDAWRNDAGVLVSDHGGNQWLRVHSFQLEREATLGDVRKAAAALGFELVKVGKKQA